MVEKKIIFLMVALVVTLSISFGMWHSGLDSFADPDMDGVSAITDNCPKVSNPDQTDFDGDRIGNECDSDDDNDTILDESDAFDDDPTEWSDADLDQIGDNKDTDDDNDNVIDAIDAFDTDPSEWADFDFDGTGAIQDPDDDNDGILDVHDPSPTLTSEQLATKNLERIEGCALLDSGTASLLCYGNFFDDLVKQQDNNVDALKLSIDLSKLGTIGDCHFISHEIGHAAYEENPDVISNLVGIDGSLCRGGYFHGTLASYFHDVKEDGELFPQNYDTICDVLIGTSNYQDCVHGLGHGLVHYYLDDLSSSVQACNNMSLYQKILCVKGVMMQYTDNEITRNGLTDETLSNLCPKSELDELDYQQCNMSIGSTLAFHTSHDLEIASKSCEMIQDQEARSFCLEGLRLEVEDSKKYLSSPLSSDIREKYQPQWIKQDDKEWIVDIRSPAIISDFEYFDELKLMQFSFDRPSYIIMYVPSELMPKKSVVTINGVAENDITFKNIFVDTNYVVIQINTDNSGTLMITGVE